LIPLTGRSKAVQIQERSAVESRVADLDDTAKTDQCFFTNFIAVKQVWVIQEISQEPAQLPERLGCAVESSADLPTGQLLGLQSRESQDVERFLRMPTVLGFLHANQEDSIRHLVFRSGLL